MKIITTPTCIPGDECDTLLSFIDFDDLPMVKAELSKIMQEAFDAGMQAQAPVVVKQANPAPVAEIAMSKGGKVTEFRTWEAIDEDGPANPIEVFIYNDAPNPDGEVNIEGFYARLRAALQYAARGK